MTAPQTLAAAWQDHAGRTLRIDCSAEQVRREKREWYYARLIELRAQEPSPERDALLAECLGFARTIGSAVECASA